MPALPLHPYLVCATQRSGSTLLCETLRETGVAGRPLEHFEVKRATGRPPQPREYFDGVRDAEILSLLAPTPPPAPSAERPDDWWRRVLAEGSTPNGVWGGKLMWDQVAELTGRFREILGRPDASLRDGIDELLGDTRMVFVSRPDRVDQAVSLWKAVQTQEWREDGTAATHEPRYSHAGIRVLADRLEGDDRAWRSWFAAQDIEPYDADYDRLESDPKGTAADVLAYLEIEGAEIPEPPTERQADDVSREWALRYREEAGP